MVFNSDVFLFGFFPVVFALFWTLHSKGARYRLLALSGYVFYGYWNWRYCFLLLFSSLVSFAAGQLIDRSSDDRRRRMFMVGTVTVDLTILGIFKYYDFFVRTWADMVGETSLALLHVALPIGISFYTFHTISYVIDVYHRRVRATSNFWEYLTYVNLFSQLVAGPIVRFRQIEEDLERIDGPPKDDWMARGFGMFAIGMVKKVIIADHIASGINPILADYQHLTFVEAWVTAIGYTCQLYFDFSGYSDMAIGLGYMFGLRIPKNFDSPYRSAGIADFWRRWHISLSSWLRDYLYVSLGGNRKGTTRMYVNLMAVMLIGGLWHGANWTFVAWGGYHGLLLVVDRVAATPLAKLPRRVYQAGTFLCVVFGWVLFRSDNFSMAWTWLQRMFDPGRSGARDLGNTMMWTAVALTGIVFLPEAWAFRIAPTKRFAALWAALLMVSYLFMNGTDSVFLYYQF